MEIDEMMERQFGGKHTFSDGDGGYITIPDDMWEVIVDTVLREME